MRISVLIPAFNAEATIDATIQSALSQRIFPYEILVLDDGSTDNTVGIAESLGAYVVRHETNIGYGAALKNCFEAARHLGASAMVIIDSDGQHDPSEIPKLLEPLKNGFDLRIIFS